MLRIWGRANSINVQKVLWCCAELDLAFERIDAGGKFGVNDTDMYRAMNPNGLVPTIEDNGFVLWESNVIVRYLAARHSDGRLYPADLRVRFDAERWMDWQAATLWPVLRTVFIGLIRTPAAERDSAAIASSLGSAARALTILDRHLGDRAFVTGDAFTVGDIPLGIAAHRWFSLPIDRPVLSGLARWYDRLRERPGYQTHVMQPLS
jgi:glutathione S-transferase